MKIETTTTNETAKRGRNAETPFRGIGDAYTALTEDMRRSIAAIPEVHRPAIVTLIAMTQSVKAENEAQAKTALRRIDDMLFLGKGVSAKATLVGCKY